MLPVSDDNGDSGTFLVQISCCTLFPAGPGVQPEGLTIFTKENVCPCSDKDPGVG